MKKYLLLAGAMLASFTANAGLDDVFKSYTQNSSAHFKGEYMQTVVGSSFHSRNPDMFDRQLYSVQLPSWNAGCGGIDFFSGSFSLITKDEIVQMARGIAQGAPGYFFNLAMDTVCPDCAANMKELSRKLNSWNQLASGSCETFWDGFTDMTGIKSASESARNYMESEVPIVKSLSGHIDDYGTWMSEKPANAGTNRDTPVGTTAADLKKIENNAIYELFNGDADNYTSPILTAANVKVWELFMSFFGYRVLVIGDADPTDPSLKPDGPKGSIKLRDFIYGDQAQPYNARQVEMYKCQAPANANDAGCLNVVTVQIPWPGLLPEAEYMLYNAGSNPGILQLIARRQNITNDQKKFIVEYPFDYVNWSRKCFIGAQPQIAKYVAIQVTFNVLGDTLNQLATEARHQIANDGLKPEYMVTPEMIELMISNTLKEFDELRASALKDAEVSMKSISNQLQIALATGMCDEFGS